MSTPEARSSIPSGSSPPLRLLDQYLETNGLGGYSCATVGGLRLYPSHGAVVVAKQPPIDRYVLINGFEVQAGLGNRTFELSTNRFADQRHDPDGRKRVLRFQPNPWPKWTFDLDEGRTLTLECVCRHGCNLFVFVWQVEHAAEPVALRVRPLLSGRPMHTPRPESHRMNLEPECPGPRQFVWNLRPGAPPLSVLSDGEFHRQPRWIHGLAYDNLATEDLACPGEFRWTLSPRQRAHLIAGTAEEMRDNPRTANEVAHLADKLRNAERTRRSLFRSPLDRAADQYMVQGSDGRTVISGYPRGTEMGAQAMIAIRGICLSPGRLDIASAVLRTWRGRIAGGLLPSEISEQRQNPSYSSPEPSLWHIVATYEYLRAAHRQARIIPAGEREEIEDSVAEILRGLSGGSHRESFMDEDLLLAERSLAPGETGEPSLVKRVHVQALWLAALRIGQRLGGPWESLYDGARREFERTFWNDESGHLDRAIVQPPDRPLERVSSLGLEQVLAVGGLPLVCVDREKASLIVHALETAFAQPGAIRSAMSLPWLFGPLVEAWFRVRSQEPDALEEVLNRFVEPWRSHVDFGGLNHLPENAPPAGRGAPLPVSRQTAFSAAETAELLRILHLPDLQRNRDPFDDRLAQPLFL